MSLNSVTRFFTHGCYFLSATLICVSSFAEPYGYQGDNNSLLAPQEKPKQVNSLDELSLNETMQDLVNRLSLISSLQGKFTQTIVDEESIVLQETQGEFKLKRPGYLYWDTAPPFEQLVVSNSELLWVYDPDLEQVTIYPKEKMKNGPASILNGSLSELSALYHVEKRLEKNDAVSASQNLRQQKLAGFVGREFTLRPKDLASGAFVEVVLVFDQTSIRKVSMVDKLGQKTRIQFAETKTNIELDNSVFSFVTPPGTDVVTDGVSGI